MTAALLCLAAYQLLLLAVGWWARRRNRTREDFYLGGRNLGPVVAALSYSASAASAWTLLGFSGFSYALGVRALWLGAGVVLGACFAWAWVAPRLYAHSRATGHLTVLDFVLGESVGRLRMLLLWSASLVILVSFIFYVAAQFQGVAQSMSTSFSLPPLLSIAVGGLVISLYLFLGGFWAVSLTDALQGLLMLCAALLLPAAALWHIGGWDELWRGLRALGPEYLSPGGFSPWLSLLGFALGNLAVGIGAVGQPHLLLRFMALADAEALRRARILAVGWYALVFAAMFLLGLLGRVLFPALEQPESIFLVSSNALLPPIIAAALLAAVLSAVMSTVDSQLLVASSVITHDLGLGGRRNREHLRSARATVLALVLAAMLLALALPASIHERVVFAWTAIGAAFGPLVVLRLGGLRFGAGAALASLLSGFGLAVGFYYLGPDTPGNILQRLLPFCVALLVLWLGRARTPRTMPGGHPGIDAGRA